MLHVVSGVTHVMLLVYVCSYLRKLFNARMIFQVFELQKENEIGLVCIFLTPQKNTWKENLYEI